MPFSDQTATSTSRRRWAYPAFMMRIVRLVMVLLTLLCGTTVAAEQRRVPIHVQIVLDSSGSMADNDARRLSSLAGMIFSDLAGPHDSVGILSMRKGRFVHEPIGPIAERRKRVRESVRSLPFVGSTYCAEPLEEASRGLEQLRKTEPDGRQFVIFLSDGACPDDRVRDAARQLGTVGVQIFSIGLFGGGPTGGPDPTSDLRAMAALTGGEFFSASQASDLPQRFASILGRIVGSEAQTLSVESGADVVAALDGYVYDASLIVTGTRSPVIIDKAEGPVDTRLDLPRRATSSLTSPAFHVAAFGNGEGSHYAVLRIDEPAAGNWTFRVKGPADLDALLIQNYALDPVVELGQPKSVFAVDEEIEVAAWLRGKDDAKIADEGFLGRVEFTVTVADPDGKEREIVLARSADGTFRGTQKLEQAGEWTLRGRARMKQGGLDKRTELRKFEVRAAKLQLAVGHPPIDLGEVPAGTTSGAHRIDLTGSEFPAPTALRLSLEDLSGLRLSPSQLDVGPDGHPGEVTFTIEVDHPGGALDGGLRIELGAQSVMVAVRGNVIPLSFWERWGRLILTIAVALLVLFVLLFILYGFVSPHSFPADARLNWGESLDRLKKNEILIAEIQGTKSGFYRNAKLVVGGPGSFLPADGAVLAEIEATGASQVVIRSPNVELRKVNKFDDSKTAAVEGNESAMHSGEIYQIGKIFLRLR